MKLKIILFTLACLSLMASKALGAATQIPETTAPVSSIEDPSEAAAATSSDFESGSGGAGEQGEGDFCLRCYDKVKVVQDMIAIQTALLDKQKKLVHRKSKAAAEAAASANGDNENTNNSRASRLSRRFNNNNNHTNQASSSTVRSRTLQSSEPTIVVSTLRVARSPTPAANSNNQNNKLAINKKDPDLKRLKQEQQQQLNATCKMLLAVQECLAELSQECIGNLQFHSLEIYSNQWHSKLSCPYRSNPGLRVFPGLRSTYIQDETETQRVPTPRRISSNEEVRSRLHDMFPNGFARPFGVMLKPTLTNSASLRYGQMMAAQQQQQQQQEGNKQQLRDFSGHLNQQHYSHQNSYEQVGLGNDLYVGKILLVPCCFAIIVAIVALVSFYYWRPIDEDQLKV